MFQLTLQTLVLQCCIADDKKHYVFSLHCCSPSVLGVTYVVVKVINKTNITIVKLKQNLFI